MLRLCFPACILAASCGSQHAESKTAPLTSRDASAPADAALTSLADAASARVDDAGPPLPPGCVPSLDACYEAQTWADCGGAGEPRFACRLNGAVCKWFEHDCVPTGFVTSPCPAEDICCMNGSFTPEQSLAGGLDSATFFYGYGREPWTRTRVLDVAARITPALTIEHDSIVCTNGEVAGCGGGSHGENLAGSPSMLDTLAIDVWTSSGGIDYAGTRLEVEVDLTLLRARACDVPFTDYLPEPCKSATSEPRCATGGTIELSRVPKPREADLSDLAVRADLVFAPDTHVLLELAPFTPPAAP